MMDASPGILDGDCYEVDMRLEPGTNVYLTNQSYTKVHPTPHHPARLNQTFTVEDGAVLEFFPEPLIPYAESRFTSQTVFHLSGNAVLLYGDIITPGRIHHGEKYQYHSLDSRMEAYREGKLIAWDHFHLQPGIHRYEGIGALEQYTHIGALWIFSPLVNESLLFEIRDFFPKYDFLIGASLTADQGILVRMAGYHVWKLQEAIQQLAGLCRVKLLNKPPHHIRR
jgi:urease accessory protein